MVSVFEKHGEDIKTYETVSGVQRGRLLFSMAILSDCQEMTEASGISDEIDEAKELITSVIKML